MRHFTLGGICLLLLGSVALADEPARKSPVPEMRLSSDEAIEKVLAPIRDKHNVPGLVAGMFNEKGLARAGAVGLRKIGAPEAITLDDKLHLGSETKAMTATLIGFLVEEKVLSWQATVGEVFAPIASQLHSDFQRVTLEQLLTQAAERAAGH